MNAVESVSSLSQTVKTPATPAERRTSLSDGETDDTDEYWDGDYFEPDSAVETEQSLAQDKPLPPAPLDSVWPQPPPLPTTTQHKFEALHDFDSSDYGEGHLTFNAGDQFLSDNNTPIDGWLIVTRGTSTGKVPFNYMKESYDKL